MTTQEIIAANAGFEKARFARGQHKKSVPSSTKNPAVAALIFDIWFDGGAATFEEIDKRLTAQCLTARSKITCRMGVGGKNGLGLHDNDIAVELCQDNARNLISVLGATSLQAWLQRHSLSAEEFVEWLAEVPDERESRTAPATAA